METPPLTVAERISRLIEHLELSAYQFGKETGLSHQTISNVLTGKNKPSLDTLEGIARRYPHAADWLLLGTGPMLRDGRTLTPTDARPQPDPPRRAAELTQDEHKRELVATAENVLLRQIIASKDELISELRGKSLDSPDAADYVPMPRPRNPLGFGAAIQAALVASYQGEPAVGRLVAELS